MDSSLARDLYYRQFASRTESRVHKVFVMARGQQFREPTLSELISACEKVKRYSLFCLEHVAEGWFATMYDREAKGPLDQYISGGYRSTPEEAVARLWLALERGTRA